MIVFLISPNTRLDRKSETKLKHTCIYFFKTAQSILCVEMDVLIFECRIEQPQAADSFLDLQSLLIHISGWEKSTLQGDEPVQKKAPSSMRFSCHIWTYSTWSKQPLVL